MTDAALLTALRRIASLDEKNVAKYAQTIAREAIAQHPNLGAGVPPALPFGWDQEQAAKAAWMIGTLAITPIDEWKSKAEIYATLSEFRFLSTGKSTPPDQPNPITG